MRLLLVLVLIGGIAHADAPNLKLPRETPPRHLRMRPRTAATAKPEPKQDDSDEKPTTPADAPPLGSLRDLRRPISVRFNLGYVVDGTNLSGKPNMSQQPVGETEIARLRAYALG